MLAATLAAFVVLVSPGRAVAAPNDQADSATPTPSPTSTLTPTETPTPTATTTSTPTPTIVTGPSLEHIRIGNHSVTELGLTPGNGWLEGKEMIDVSDPQTRQRITDIDKIENGILWEKKSTERMQYSPDKRHTLMTQFTESERYDLIRDDIALWARGQMGSKIDSYLKAQAFMPHYERAQIGFCFHRPDNDQLAQRSSETVDEATEEQEIAVFVYDIKDVVDHLNNLAESGLSSPIALKWEPECS